MKIGNIREMDIPEMIQQAWKGVLNTWEVSSETEVEIPAALQIQVNQDTGLTSLLNMNTHVKFHDVIIKSSKVRVSLKFLVTLKFCTY